MTEGIYEFECPECGFDHKEAGQLAGENHRYCGVCAGDCGRDVSLKRWLPGKKPVDELAAAREQVRVLREAVEEALMVVRQELGECLSGEGPSCPCIGCTLQSALRQCSLPADPTLTDPQLLTEIQESDGC